MLQNFFINKNISKKKTKMKTIEHNNRQDVNICVRNMGTNRERQKANNTFLKGKCIQGFQAQYMTMKKKIGEY